MPSEPLPGAPAEPSPLSEGLSRVLRSMGGPAPAALGSLFDDWAGIVGENLAEHARPVGLRGTTLVIGVDDPGWASQVRWMTADLLRQLADGLGEGTVTAVEVRVEPRRT